MESLLQKIILVIRRFFREKLHYQSDDLPYYFTIGIAFIIFAFGLNGFVDLTEELANNNLGPFDHRVTDFVLSRRNQALTQFFVFITNVGTLPGYLVVIVLLTVFFLIKHRSWKFILQTVAVLLLATLSNMMLKEVINRARPSIEHLVVVYSLSYPSGHAMSAMGFYGFLVFLSARYRFNIVLKIILIAVLSLLIFLIGLSRVYLGVHYPSDVLAGFIGGLLWVAFCAIVFDVIDLWRRRRKRIAESNGIVFKNERK